MKKSALRRALMATALTTSLAGSMMLAVPAQAQFGGIVYDPSNYAQNVLTAARSLEQINNQIRQIENQATSLINQAKNLASLPVSTLGTLQAQVNQTRQLLAQPQHTASNVQDIRTPNLDGAKASIDTLVSASQSASGALQAAQAGNQLLALQSQQLADLTAAIAAQGRAEALDAARNAATEAEGRERFRRFRTGN